MDKHLSNLLKTKNFNELSSADKDNILKYCSKEDFEAMGHFTVGCKTNFEYELGEMEPKEYILDNLLVSYQQKYKTRPERKWNVLLLELKSSFQMPVFRYGVLGVIFLISSSILILLARNRLNNKGERATTAMDIGQIKNFEEMNKNLYFNDAGLNERMIVPESRGNP